ncbi:hypothetical protein R1T40_08540 [Tritonibacter scottomollicae]|uniref:Uncharacterized protein n=1 Tax=Tritonibacter scottomollicae TaxID=483013 RepID=A0ABZ0HKF4_TRISK|nr:hypothetical protein [Tritonibacter scottomollicae]WOI34758.1 hypothetical protein R1T40_08540 [Tritonibacter scottomollicae]
MNSPVRNLQPVDAQDLPEYPISVEDRLDSHFFIQWNLKRWRKSKFRQLAEPEVGWFGFLLFCESHDETPVATLPTDERLLAKALDISVDRWRQLCDREITPLHNWSLVRCDNGEIRFAHPVATEVAQEALKTRRKNQADTEQRKRAKRLKDLREMIEQRVGAGQLLRNPDFLERFNDWLEARYPEAQRREPFIRSALEEFQVEMAR